METVDELELTEAEETELLEFLTRSERVSRVSELHPEASPGAVGRAVDRLDAEDDG